jgi:hypothetical protein
MLQKLSKPNMKAILEFNLPEEEDEHDTAMKGLRYRSVIDHTMELIRNKLKHGHTYKTPEDALEDIRREILVWLP